MGNSHKNWEHSAHCIVLKAVSIAYITPEKEKASESGQFQRLPKTFELFPCLVSRDFPAG